MLRTDLKCMLVSMIQKIKERSSLKCDFLANLDCLNPKKISLRSTLSLMKKIEGKFSHKILTVEDCDHVETEYKVFIGQAKYYSSDEFGAYDVKSNSLDSFYVGHEINQKFPNLWELMKIVFVLSHGQASVERGFSVNKEVLTGNMKGRTIIACIFEFFSAIRRLMIYV